MEENGQLVKNEYFFSRKKKQNGESFSCKTDASTSKEVTVIFLILKVHVKITESFAQNPSAMMIRALYH